MKYPNPEIRQQRRNSRNPKSGHVRTLPVSALRPSPENERLYRTVNLDDPSVHDLAQSIREIGLSVPITVSQGYFKREGPALTAHEDAKAVNGNRKSL